MAQEQIEVFRTLLATAGPTEAQQKDIDYLLAGGEIFALVVYGQLVLENARIYDLGDDMVDEIFDFMVRDFSERALKLHNQPSTTDKQMALCMKMLRKPVPNAERYQRVWQDHVCAERGVYFGP